MTDFVVQGHISLSVQKYTECAKTVLALVHQLKNVTQRNFDEIVRQNIIF